MQAPTRSASIRRACAIPVSSRKRRRTSVRNASWRRSTRRSAPSISGRSISTVAARRPASMSSNRAASARCATSSKASRSEARTPFSPRPYSITANSRSGRRRLRCRPPAWRFARRHDARVPWNASQSRARKQSARCPAVSADWLDAIRWNADGLVPVIAQDAATHRVLTLAWMNRAALARTDETREAHYWSRSRRALWRKGERSGHVQRVREIRLDCDRDALLLIVEPVGGIACHTGRERCFYQRLEHHEWQTVEPVLEDPVTIYGNE